MSAAVTAPAPDLRKYMMTGSSCSEETTRFLRLRRISVTSSFTPSIVVNSCRTPSKRTLVTAAPGMDESNVRRSEFPRVYPKPGSSGLRENWERLSAKTFSVKVGRCAISTFLSFPSTRYLMLEPAGCPFRQVSTSINLDDAPVSYTHLRAHE